MSTPTPEQIKTVQTNIGRMITFNDHVYNFGHTKIEVAFKLLSRTDTSDPGFTFGINLLESTFRGLGAVGGPLGTFTASLLCGVVSDWTKDKPKDLTGTFVSLDQRFQKSVRELDLQLGILANDVPANWTKKFTFNGKEVTLADFADPDKLFPTQTFKPEEFKRLTDEALHGVDRSVWQEILATQFQVTRWVSSQEFKIRGGPNNPPIEWVKGFIAKHPAYRETWNYQAKSGCGSFDGWVMGEYSVGVAPGVFSDGAISDEAARYLFIDSVPGVVINPEGVYLREEVFTGIGIPVRTKHVNTGGGFPAAAVAEEAVGEAAPRQLSFGYLRAMKEGKTLTALIQAEGREAVQSRVIAAAHADPIFAHDLSMRPRQTLEEFLGVKIADVIDVVVTVEGSRTFGLVIPEPPAPNE
jgi:hypothetical protein